MSKNGTSETLQGWTASPDGRGTFDILWPCVATIFLSTWSAICLNVPDPSDTIWKIVKRKTWITFVSVMGPEYLLGYALGDWQSARTSVARLKQLRQDDRWTLQHAFFADMGGFVLRTSDNISFFLDTRQIHWLLEHQAISYTQFEQKFLLDPKVIDDRNKSDTFVRVLAAGQALWFCIQIIARGAQGLAVTTLELTTVGIVVDSILVYYIWGNKPANVESTEVIDIAMTLSEIVSLEEDKEARAISYLRAPLDFVGRETWSLNLMYHYLMNILKNMVPRSRVDREQKSLGRRSENDVLLISGVAWLIGLCSTVVFMGINFIAWNFQFPTPTEKLLWRISSCGLVVLLFIVLFVFEIIFNDRATKKMQERVRERREALEQSGIPNEKSPWKDRLIYRLRAFGMGIRNNSLVKDPNLDVSVGFVVSGVPIFVLYVVFRAYILVEDVIAFRALPSGAYQTVSWWQFVPHIG